MGRVLTCVHACIAGRNPSALARASDNYRKLSLKLTDCVLRYMRAHRLILAPYISDLLKKEEDGHDCQACGASCSVKHSYNIKCIREEHAKLHELLEQLRMENLTMYYRGAHRFDSFVRLH